jgi:hypothetical protein
MRTFFLTVTLSIGAVALAMSAGPGHAQGITQHYPYCALDSSTGATSCYYSTREQCGSRCISNPGYVGPEAAMGSARGSRNRHAPRH